jgi:hypothetical protein
MSALNPLSPKDPNAVLDYEIDWSKWLPMGDTILTSEWLVADGIDMDSETNTNTTTTIWLSGGTAGQRYSLTNRITTTGGRTQDRTIVIRVKEL